MTLDKKSKVLEHFEYIGRLTDPRSFFVCNHCQQAIPDYIPAMARHLHARHQITLKVKSK